MAKIAGKENRASSGSGMASFRRARARAARRAAQLLFRPPVVVFLGKRGVGKSSTLNALFGLDLPSDAAVECTTVPSTWKVANVAHLPLTVVDMPGIAANLETAGSYHRHYEYWMARADVLVWLTQANVRSYTRDQRFFLEFGPSLAPTASVIIAISKFDTQDPAVGIDGAEIDKELHDKKIADVKEQLTPYLPKGVPVRLVPYSVVRKWNLDALSSAFIGSEA